MSDKAHCEEKNMDYKELMKDCVYYINNHLEEKHDAERLGKIYSCKGEFLSWMFQCFYKESLEDYLERLNEIPNFDSGGDVHKNFPEKRNTGNRRVRITYTNLEPFFIEAHPVIQNMDDVDRPIDAAMRKYKRDSEEALYALWWHDEDYDSRYMQGKALAQKAEQEEQEETEIISVPAGKYAVFSIGKYGLENDLAEEMKYLIHYAYLKWIPRNAHRVDLQGYSFEQVKDGHVYYYLALLEKEKEEPLSTVYGVDSWTRYINENIFSNLTTDSLAKKFNYSSTHFKRVFRAYYNMSVSDYIRKRKLTLIAAGIRGGLDYGIAAEMYGYKTYAGFKKAFEKEFNMSPAIYSKGVFSTINLADYYAERKDCLKLSIVDLKSIHMIGHTVFPSRGSDMDIAAQVNYWVGKDFPCLENTRYSCNVEQREDKIALWYPEEETGDIEYILGPVVKEFTEDIPENMKQVTLEGGRYAIFETEKYSDEDDIAETLRMYTRCVFYGWVKEHRECVDLSRITFERYVNSKIYLYVPLKKTKRDREIWKR